MVLTVALGKFRAVFDDRQTFTDMADYQCDAVSIRQVSVKARPTRSGGLMHFDADIFTERGRDKVANLLLELLLDDQVVVTKALHRLDAEEDTLRGLSTVLHLPAEAMMREAKAELRITVTVHEEP